MKRRGRETSSNGKKKKQNKEMHSKSSKTHTHTRVQYTMHRYLWMGSWKSPGDYTKPELIQCQHLKHSAFSTASKSPTFWSCCPSPSQLTQTLTSKGIPKYLQIIRLASKQFQPLQGQRPTRILKWSIFNRNLPTLWKTRKYDS